MTALFVHDHKFNYFKENYYSDKLPYYIWKRYLNHFDSLYVFGRVNNSKFNIDNQSISSGNNVKFIIGENISNFKSFFIQRNIEYKKMEEIINNVDIVIARLPSEYGVMAISIAKKIKKPYVIEVVGCPFDSLWNYGNIKGKLFASYSMIRLKKIIGEAKYVHYVSDSFLQNRYKSHNLVVTASISNVEIEDTDGTILEKRKNKILNTSFNLIKFGIIGSFSNKYKGIHTAIESLAIVNKKDKKFNFELHILGDGDKDYYIELSKRLGVEDKVYFDGVLPSGDEVFKWLDEIDIYLQPSMTEGKPRALIEAMSRACPCIASTAGGIKELLPKHVTFPPGNKRIFSELIKSNYNNKNWYFEHATNNFEVSKKYFKDYLDEKRFKFFEDIKKEITGSNEKIN